MKAKVFAERLESVREGGSNLRGEKSASRAFSVSGEQSTEDELLLLREEVAQGRYISESSDEILSEIR